MHGVTNIKFKKTPRNIWELPNLNVCWGTGYPEPAVPWFLCFKPNRPSKLGHDNFLPQPFQAIQSVFLIVWLHKLTTCWRFCLVTHFSGIIMYSTMYRTTVLVNPKRLQYFVSSFFRSLDRGLRYLLLSIRTNPPDIFNQQQYHNHSYFPIPLSANIS